MTNDAAFAPNALPSPADVLTRTRWSELSHAMGQAADVPSNLAALLDPDRRRRSSALNFLHGVVHHQNTLYEATIPAAQYVAGILSDPRTAQPIDLSRNDLPGPMRAALLGWLGSVAYEANDTAEARLRHFGFPADDYLPFVQTRQLLPLLFGPVSALTQGQDLAVREAAIAACLPLADDARLRHHRTSLTPLLREVLGVSDHWRYPERGRSMRWRSGARAPLASSEATPATPTRCSRMNHHFDAPPSARTARRSRQPLPKICARTHYPLTKPTPGQRPTNTPTTKPSMIMADILAVHRKLVSS